MHFGKYLPIYLLALIHLWPSLMMRAEARSDQTHRALNAYVDFANESMHILWAVHLRLEAYNIQSNLYLEGDRPQGLEFRIDDIIRNFSYYGNLQGVCLRAYGVVDPSVNLEFLYQETRVRELAIPYKSRSQINRQRDKLWSLIGLLMTYCDSLTQYTQQEQYRQDPGLDISYATLNQCALLFDHFQEEKGKLMDLLNGVASPRPQALADLNSILEQTRYLLLAMRNEETNVLKLHVSQLQYTIRQAQVNQQTRLEALTRLGLYYDRGTTVYKHVISYANQMVKWTQNYLNQGPVSPIYEDYGREYYFYNERLLSSYNHHKYGLLAYYNQFLGFANTTLLKHIEETPRFIVIAPNPKNISQIQSDVQPQSVEEIPLPNIHKPALANAATNHLIFLLDVSASMRKPEKLSLLKQSLADILPEMREEDRISLITYSGNAQVVLEAASAQEAELIMEAVNGLGSSGETHFQKGLKAAYELAQEKYIIHGNNRIILATDGDFIFKSAATRLAEKYSAKPIYLSVLLFSKFETILVREQFTRLALAGNGNYVHVQEDNADLVLLEEARAVSRK